MTNGDRRSAQLDQLRSDCKDGPIRPKGETKLMCSHYEAPTPSQLAAAFGIDNGQQGKLDLWPGYIGPFLRSPASLDDESVNALGWKCWPVHSG